MKKLLLGTTAIASLAISSAALAGGSHSTTPVAAPVAAGGLSVMIGGYIDVQHSYSDQEQNAGSTGNFGAVAAGNERDVHFTNEAEVHVTVAGSTDDFDYGGVIELLANIDDNVEASYTNNTQGNNDLNADKVYLFVEGDEFGRAEFGSNTGASGTLEIDASNIARATGGIEGDWWHYVDVDGVSATAGTQITTTAFKIEPNLPVADDVSLGADASKITYYTPRFGGLQLGVSYTPDTGDLGTAGGLSTKATGNQFENVWAGGINYDADFDGVGVALAAVGEVGENESSTFEDLAAYSLGAKVSVEGFSIAGNWADQGDSGLSTATTGADEQQYWTLGAAFENGPYGVSVTYIDSTQSSGGAGAVENELTNIVVGADYQLAPGFTPYVEAAFFDLDDGTAANTDNDGSVVILGAELSF